MARAIVDAGSELVVALSKADRLSEAELAEAGTYAVQQFDTVLGLMLQIGTISTLEGRTDRVAQWFEQALAPKIADAQDHAAASLRRKIGTLRESVMAVLEARLQSGKVAADNPVAADKETLPAARARIQKAREGMLDVIDRVPRCVDDLVDTVAKTLLACWTERTREAAETEASVERALSELSVQIGEVISEPLTQLRADLEQVLASYQGQDAGKELPTLRARPVFDATFVARQMPLHAPHTVANVRWLLKWLAQRRAARSLSSVINEQLSLFAQALRAWALRSLEELASRFDALVAQREGAERMAEGVPATAEAAEQARRDLERLRSWPANAPSPAAMES